MRWKSCNSPTRGYPHTKPYGVVYTYTRTTDPKNIKVKGKFVPVYAMNAYRGRSRGTAPFILNFGINGRDWSITRSGRFIPVKRTMVFTEQEAGWAPELV